MDEFFRVHSDLPREGPGDPADIARTARLAGLPEGARIADMGCGPGADVAGLLDAFPGSRVTAVDAHRPFVEAVRRRFGASDRVEAIAGDMGRLEGPFDLIWSAGALYFLGLGEGLRTMRGKLAPEGVIAFSHPCHFVENPSAAARAFWQGEGDLVESRDAIREAVRAAGYDLLDDWPVSDEGWTLYYTPLLARVAELRGAADPALEAVLDRSEAEAASWEGAKAETGYLLVVARAA
jgi:trans-aconitate methyltransferase